jgi:hypothetical protein
MSERDRERDDDRGEGKTDRGGSYYSAEEEADEAAADLGRRQGPGAESTGDTGSGGPGSTSQKSRGG